MNNFLLPQIGDKAPSFPASTQKGTIQFPEAFRGHWTIFFAHPANFTSAWVMYSTLISMKERFFTERNTKLLALSHDTAHKNDFSDKVRRYIGIYLKAPVFDDSDYSIANLYGMASRRQKEQNFGRLAFIIDPEGIIRSIIENPQPSIETVIKHIEAGLDQVQGKAGLSQNEAPTFELDAVEERLDVDGAMPTNPAYFNKNELLKN